jgi:hypothetical protein
MATVRAGFPLPLNREALPDTVLWSAPAVPGVDFRSIEISSRICQNPLTRSRDNVRDALTLLC